MVSICFSLFLLIGINKSMNVGKTWQLLRNLGLTVPLLINRNRITLKQSFVELADLSNTLLFGYFKNGFSNTIGPLHDPVTWYKITHTGEQVAQRDFQNNAPAFVLEDQ